MDSIYFVCEDVLVALESLPVASIDVICTSPPYNNGVDYGTYKDKRERGEYLQWLGHYVFGQLRRVLKPEGSFFLNMGWQATDPWIADDVVAQARSLFALQNKIAWVKSIALGDEPCRGHNKPINSARFLNRQWEEIYHFTHTGEVAIDRLAVGVPYADESNLDRGTRGQNGNVRCRGDVLFCPYETVSESKGHPCPFPVQLVEYCLKLHGVREDLILLDPFAGTCASAVAAKNLGCWAIMVDQNVEYLRAGRKRIYGADVDGEDLSAV